MQTETPPRAAHQPSIPFNERLHWSMYVLVAGVFFLPWVPVAVVASVLVPWFVADRGRIVDGALWLDAPLSDLLPAWVFWGAGGVLVFVVALLWGTAVHLFAQALRGRRSRPGQALVRSLVRSPLTLAAGAVTAGALFAVDSALLAVDDQAHPALRFGSGAALFASLTPLWLPIAAVHTRDRPLAFLAGLRGRGLLTGSGGAGQWGAVSAVVGCAAVVAYLGAGITTENALIPTLIAALVGLTVAALALTLAAVGEGPAPQTQPGHPYLAAGLAVAIAAGLTAPTQLYQNLLTDGPWPTLRYDTLSLTPWGRHETAPRPLLLPEDGASVLVGTREVLCGEDAECMDLDTPVEDMGPTLAVIGTAGGAVRTVHPTRQVWLPQGSIVLHDRCLRAADCESGTWTIEPPVEPDGRWGAEVDDPVEQTSTRDIDSLMAAWGGAGGGRHLVVTAVPSVGRSETLLTLSGCSTDGCRDQASTLLVRAPGDAFTSRNRSPRSAHPSLISVTADEEGAGRVSVHHPDTGALTLYACHDVECGDVTATELVPPTGVSRFAVPEHTRYTGAPVRIRPDGTPVLVHLDTRDGSVQLIDCADVVCAERDTVRVLGPGWQRTPPALALDSAGLPQIATYDTTTREVLYLACADERCQDYDRTVVGVYDRTPGWIDLELDGADRPHLVWHRVADERAGEEHAYELVRCARSHCRR
ncbi:hypothetical protein [Nocardiopsis sp. CC223A]|uniref:hypothetical protein n=1 Tax=Nocardiopsis sp. CC223A TaxID=3044051 RepID=UPI00278C1FBC|nr:hypothetical protein [Nocardiopsis sp. CC223A]